MQRLSGVMVVLLASACLNHLPLQELPMLGCTAGRQQHPTAALLHQPGSRLEFCEIFFAC